MVPFIDYFPDKFEDIRLRGSNIQTSDYVKSLRKTTKERFSEGASGAFLFFSADQKYIIKSMTKEECQVLLRILPSYHEYVIAHPTTFLTKYVGCHSVSLQYTGKVYFCVMKNIFGGDSNAPAKKIHETYDLKGSWVNRAGALPSNKAFTECRFCGQWYRVGGRQSLPGQTCSVRPNGQHRPRVILKDLDVNWRFELDEETGEALHQQLCMDSNFLCSHEIMDYSLLIGVERRRIALHGSSGSGSGSGSGGSGGSGSGSGGSGSGSSTGGSTTGQEGSNQRFSVAYCTAPSSYTFGIIDMLQEYTVDKKLEHFWKTKMKGQSKHGISCVDYAEYKKRFHKRVCSAFIRPMRYVVEAEEAEEVEKQEKQKQKPSRVVKHNRNRSNSLAGSKREANQRRASVFDSNAMASMAGSFSIRNHHSSNTTTGSKQDAYRMNKMASY